MKSDAIVDARGYKCPWGITQMKKVFKKQPDVRVIELQSDDRVSASQVPAWCELAGHTYLGSKPAGDYVRYFVKRREA